jgi:hypothetical protein
MLCADILRASCPEGDVFRCERARNTGKRRTTCVGAKRAVVATRRFTAENVRHRCYYSKPGSMATIGRWYQARIGLSGNALEKRGERRLRHPSARAASRRAIDRRTRRCEGAERGSDGSDAASCNPGHQSGHGMPCPNTDTPTPTIIAYRGISRSAACRAPTLCPNTDTPTPTIIAYRGISRGTACRAPTLRPNTDTPTPTIIAYRGISRGTACRAPTLRPNTDTPTPTIIAYRGISRGTAMPCPNTDTPTPTIIAYRGISRSAACAVPMRGDCVAPQRRAAPPWQHRKR